MLSDLVNGVSTGILAGFAQKELLFSFFAYLSILKDKAFKLPYQNT